MHEIIQAAHEGKIEMGLYTAKESDEKLVSVCVNSDRVVVVSRESKPGWHEIQAFHPDGILETTYEYVE